MLGGDAKTLAVSVAIHGGIIAVLAVFAARHVADIDEPAPIDLEILPATTKVPPPPRVAETKPPEVKPPPVPVTERPKAVPRRAKVRVTKTPTPFQPDAPDTPAVRNAPPDTEAVARPTAPIPEIDMETTVGAGGGDYSSTATYGGDGTVAVGHGPGGQGHGAGGGSPGPLANQGAVGVKVSRDWEVTTLPQPLNDRSFDPHYPPRAKREKREARITLRLDIDHTGRVAKASVLDGPRGHGFRRSAIAYARKLKFRPALAGKRKVAARIEWTVLFYVRN